MRLCVLEVLRKLVDVEGVILLAGGGGCAALQNHTFGAAKGMVLGGNMCPFASRKGTYCGTGVGSVKNVRCEKAFRQIGGGRDAAGGWAAV